MSKKIKSLSQQGITIQKQVETILIFKYGFTVTYPDNDNFNSHIENPVTKSIVSLTTDMLGKTLIGVAVSQKVRNREKRKLNC
ncbi:hypothetical protein [Pedobacter steynii]